ncbi:low molecular weight protein-tyrosine-phosphatase [Thiomicrospira cyclica]|uniref:protein-tyrosine-phosphatase n=1 Tax=Thiomicrospira cyclica (strain DSM 14477 / JCM 11371 / ALM1) TaxID=717773 RepID=F6DBC6_THICA|nr:low molecular weight protein-tyrosine-phosphatase [Thiomicrospira cyclica]AEG31234.1 protein tyrosine phosphatase [Thiomicrospira cyclica ALM1]
MSQSQSVGVLFICMGNICRSPTAHAVFRKLVEQAGLVNKIRIDSAGTHAYHIGNPPDPRSMETAASRNIAMADLRARKVAFSDFYEFDYLLVMDDHNYQLVIELGPREEHHRVSYLLDFAPEVGRKDVPDPYYGGPQGFEQVFDMVETACANLLSTIRQKQGW